MTKAITVSADGETAIEVEVDPSTLRPHGLEAEFLIRIRAESKKRVESVLNGLYRTFGRMDREELGALLDGAQDATMNWTPPK